MPNLRDQIQQLANNVFRGTSIAASFRKAPIELRDNSPTSILDNDPLAFASISYPRDVTQDMQNGHYMLFYINVQNKTKYIMNPYDADPASSGKIGETILYPKGDRGERTQPEFTSYGSQEATYREGLIKKGGTGNVLNSDGVSLRKGRKPMTGLGASLTTTTRITDSIAIYLPPNVQDATGVAYNNEAETGIIGMAAATGGMLAKQLRTKDMAGALKGIGGAAVELLKVAGMNLGGRALGELGEFAADVEAEDIKALANKAFGRATNPFMEVLFTGVDMRTFDYTFTFQPRNEDETNDVQKIIKMFRFHMMPELRGANQRFLTLPSTFDIHYMYQMTRTEARENSFYNKIATCVLTSCDVDYTPGGVKSFASGAPTQITMALSFMETEQLSKQHVDQGF